MRKPTKVATAVTAAVVFLVGVLLELNHVQRGIGEFIVVAIFTVGISYPRFWPTREFGRTKSRLGSSRDAGTSENGGRLIWSLGVDVLRATCAATFLFFAAQLFVATLDAGASSWLEGITWTVLTAAFPFVMPFLGNLLVRAASTKSRGLLESRARNGGVGEVNHPQRPLLTAASVVLGAAVAILVEVAVGLSRAPSLVAPAVGSAAFLLVARYVALRQRSGRAGVRSPQRLRAPGFDNRQELS
ncbi:MAG: hypothetical protein M0Z92_08240 [Actinomycetota bacterium]|nr:hypothetical protein [Actinomycetota bacterium]